MLRWHSRIYLGRDIKEKFDKIKPMIESGDCEEIVYLITLAENIHEQLDIYGTHMLRSSLKINPEPVVVGLASGRRESWELVASMALDAIKEIGSADFRRFFAL